MIPGMPRPRPPFLSREVTRHGRPVWYVRRSGKRIRLRAEYGTAEFEAEYQAALASSPNSGRQVNKLKSVYSLAVVGL